MDNLFNIFVAKYSDYFDSFDILPFYDSTKDEVKLQCGGYSYILYNFSNNHDLDDDDLNDLAKMVDSYMRDLNLLSFSD